MITAEPTIREVSLVLDFPQEAGGPYVHELVLSTLAGEIGDVP